MSGTNADLPSGVFGNLLDDNLIRARVRNREMQSVTLPKLLALLIADEIDDLPALRPHQRFPLHCFLTQIGAMAMLAAGESVLPREADRWRDLLRGLTPGFANDEPWTLVVDDLAKPAFLQPPVPEGAWQVLKETEVTPDALDMLVTSKNHDLKAARLGDAVNEYWLYALITLQTFEGFLGRGNYGISRMNGGFASRPFVGLAPVTGGLGAHIVFDIARLVEHRTEIIAADELHKPEGGCRLLWLEPWDGQTSYDPRHLNPYYVEICRRIRFRLEADRIVAHRGSSSVARINQPKGNHQGKDFTLPTGDPWTPVEKDSGKPLTLDNSGFHYRRIVSLLSADRFNPAPLQMLYDTDTKGAVQMVFAAIVRGQGETQGYHERRVAIPERLRPVFMRKDSSCDMARVANDRVSDVSAVSKALGRALFALYQAGTEKIDFKDPKAKAKAKNFTDQFEDAVDEDFFDHLFQEVAVANDTTAALACRKHWIENCLWPRARDALAAAEAGSPFSSVRRYRARGAAKARLDGAIVDAFPDLLKRKPAA